MINKIVFKKNAFAFLIYFKGNCMYINKLGKNKYTHGEKIKKTY